MPKIEVQPDWWKDLFDEVYLQTDADSVCNDELTAREVDCIEAVLRPRKDDPILGLCGGQGRHELELAKRGYIDLTTLDYAKHLIQVGRNTAVSKGLNVRFIQGDARETRLPAKHFKFVTIMGHSFGYFTDDSENRKILREAFRLLQAGGTLMLDLSSKEHALKSFKPYTCKRIPQHKIIVGREKELRGSIVNSVETIISYDGKITQRAPYSTRLYDENEIKTLLEEMGFKNISIFKDFMDRSDAGRDYGFMSNRILATAQKPHYI